MVRDVVIAGAGPAALALADALAARDLGVTVIAGAPAPWPNTYGDWVDELADAGLSDVLGTTWSDARVILADDDVRALGRAYARVDGEALRQRQLDRCAARGVDILWDELAAELQVDDRGTTAVTDAGTVVRARLGVDATGHQARFLRRSGAATSWQTAVGWEGPLTPALDDPSVMTFMDLRTDHVDGANDPTPDTPTFVYAMPLGSGRAFVEETALVASPAVSFDVLRSRLERRLAHLGWSMDAVHATEHCRIPMDTPLPDREQPLLGYGGAASLVHPASGYMLARAFGTAPEVAAAVSDALRAGHGPAAVARAAWHAVWTDDDLLRRQLHLFGSELLTRLDASEQRAFFGAFFSMPRSTWSGYLSSRGDVASVVRAMASMLVHSGFRIRWKLLRSGARLPRALLRAV
ncbi:MAG: lycopene cyclase family protein [Alphaproteobacteria bacterium]|nr:lycopene cyclase family protein [Alphaproteobacteria bacterium]